jgi:hypothetical protein
VRQVFTKEWRQGQLIALFGFLMGGLITALWGLLTVAWVKDWRDQEAVNGFCGVIYVLLLPVLAGYVGAGLVAAETERGTLSLLLGLPFSRRQVWLGKFLAGLALTISAVALAVVPGAIATRPALEEVHFWEILPDLAFGSLLIFVISFFWSTRCATIISAFLNTTLLTIGLALFVLVWMAFLGTFIGYGPLLDGEIWALAVCIGLVVGSYFGFSRGDVLLSQRRRLLPLALAVATFLMLSLPIIALVRWDTRYERAKVAEIETLDLTGGGSAISVYTRGSPVRFLREVEAKWFADDFPDYRANYAVCVDLTNGKELLTRRETRPPVLSPDGKLAAVVRGPRPLTWAGYFNSFPATVLEVWDVANQRLLYRGTPPEGFAAGQGKIGWLAWSPDGEWIAVAGDLRYHRHGPGIFDQMLLMRPDGSQVRVVHLEEPRHVPAAWDWAPDGKAIYVVREDGVLIRRSLLDNTADTIWEGPAEHIPYPYRIEVGAAAASPEGRWIAVAMKVYYIRDSSYVGTAPASDASGEYPKPLLLVYLVSADGSTSQLLFKEPAERAISHSELVWSPGGDAFYYITGAYPRRPSEPESVWVVAWTKGSDRASLATLSPGTPLHRTAVLPDGYLLVSPWKQGCIVTPDGRVATTAGKVAGAFEDWRLVGVDARGRAIVTRWRETDNEIAAIDLGSGEVTAIYP